MSDHSSKDLDKMFQVEPEQFPFEYNPEAWREMEVLLEKDDRRRIIFWWLFGIGALVLVAGIWFLGNKNDVEKFSNSNLGKEEKTETVKNKENITIYSREIILDKNTTVEEQLTKESPTNFSQKQNSNSTPQKDNLTQKNNFIKTIEDDFSNLTPLNENPSEPNYFFDKKTKTTIPFEKNDTTPSEKSKTRIEISPIAFKKVLIPIENKNNSLNLIPSIKLDEAYITDMVECIIIPNYKFFGLLAGAESSWVGNDNWSTPNLKIGGLFSYRFRNKWGVNVGANFIQKKYGAKGNAYNPPAGFWDAGVPPTTVKANCNILEVPVNIEFFQKYYYESGFYSSLGLTSFFMLNEKYDYAFPDTAPTAVDSWKGKNKNQHWFGIGEISIGYQKKISYRQYFQLGTYLQIPLTGVGHGKVKLWSLGLQMKYNFRL